MIIIIIIIIMRVTTYFNTPQLLPYKNRNSKLLQNLVQYGGNPSLNLLLALPALCPHRPAQRCNRLSLTFTDADLSGDVECSCERCMLLCACFCTERIPCFACICAARFACYTLPSVRGGRRLWCVSVTVRTVICLMCACVQAHAAHLYCFTPSIYFCTLPLTRT
jgi:hypothetical protein